MSTFNLAVLMVNLLRASDDPLVGFEDADRTLKEMELLLMQHVHLHRDVISSALWCCNLLSEKGEFFHPRGLTFDEFVARLLPYDTFNKDLNLITNEADFEKA